MAYSDLTKVKNTFKEKFSSEPELCIAAPGRINLIGEHTDYNDGFVLPASIDKSIFFAIRKRADNVCNFYSVDLEEAYSSSLDLLDKTDCGWVNYLIGVALIIKAKDYCIPSGFDVAFGGNVPLGAGLSSSAAVESGMGFALNELFGLGCSRKELALIAQQAEQQFAGVNCGIMDMYASLLGKEAHVIQLDCRTLEHTYFPLEIPDYQLILCNTGVKHSLAESAYNNRRLDCEKGVKILQEFYAITHLRDVTPEQLYTKKNLFEPTVYQHCEYVVNENERVQLACKALETNNLVAFGELLYETHEGLSKVYEVSCKELDFLVEFTKYNPNVLGARMMGGGFGGCTLNLVKKSHIASFISAISEAYQRAFCLELTCYEVIITDGVRIVE